MAVVGRGTTATTHKGTAGTTGDYTPAAAFPCRSAAPPLKVGLGQPSGEQRRGNGDAALRRTAGGNSTATARLHTAGGGGRGGRKDRQEQRVLVPIIAFHDGMLITNAYIPLFNDSLASFVAKQRFVGGEPTSLPQIDFNY